MSTPEDSTSNGTESSKDGTKVTEVTEVKEVTIETIDPLLQAYKTVYAYRDELIKKENATPQEQQEIDAINFLFPDGTEGKAEDFVRYNKLIAFIVENETIDIITLYRDFDKMELRHLSPVVAYAKKYKDIEIYVNELTGEIKYIK